MSVIDTILEKVGLKYDDLSAAERETLYSMLHVLESNQLTVSHFKGYITKLKEAIESELVKTDNGNKQDIFLKARLRNMLLIEAFLTTPEKAKEALDRAIAGIVNSKGGENNGQNGRE